MSANFRRAREGTQAFVAELLKDRSPEERKEAERCLNAIFFDGEPGPHPLLDARNGAEQTTPPRRRGNGAALPRRRGPRETHEPSIFLPPQRREESA